MASEGSTPRRLRATAIAHRLAVLACALVALGASVRVDRLHTTSMASWQRAVSMATLEADVNRLRALRWREREEPGAFRGESARRLADEVLVGLAEAARDGDYLAVRSLIVFGSYARNLRAELDASLAGDTARADHIYRTRTQPQTAALERMLTASRAAARREAEAASAEAEQQAFVLGAGVLGLVVGVFALIGRARRRAQIATARAGVMRASEQRFRTLVDKASDMMTVVAPDGTIRTQNGSIERMLGVAAEDVVGRPLAELVHPDDAGMVAAFTGGGGRRGDGAPSVEWRMRRADGTWLHVQTNGTDLLDDPAVGGIVLTTRDIEARKTLEEQLRHRAYHDPLTGLPNRALFWDRLGQAAVRSHGGHTRVAVVFLDLDGFKQINDQHGHATGDLLLQAAARRLESCLRGADTAARLGGDEFGVLLEDVGGMDDALVVAGRMADAFADPFRVQDELLQVQASAGVAVAPAGMADPATLLRQADVAMYAAKAFDDGRRVRAFEEGLEDRIGGASAVVDSRAAQMQEERRAEIAAILADVDRCLEIVYQPVLDLRSGLVRGYEALSRFPTLAGRGADSVFAQAHECGLGPQLEAAAIRMALAAPGRPAGTSLSLNLSPSVLIHGEDTGLPARLDDILIEVTEHELVSEGPELEEALAALRARGAEIAVDDAGAGYAGFTQLLRLRPDVVKLDRSLADGVDSDPVKAALVESFTRFASRIGASVCAEGIETLDQLAALADLDVSYGQGYAIARPGAPWPVVEAAVAAMCSTSLAAAMDARSRERRSAQTGDWHLEELAERISRADTLTALAGCMPAVAKELQANEAFFSELDPTEGYLSTLAAHDWVERGDRYELAAYPATEAVLRSQQAAQVLVSDPDCDPREAAILREHGYASALMVPVMCGGRTLGLLEAYAYDERPWSRSEICRAHIIAHQLGAAIERLSDATGAPRHSEPPPARRLRPAA